MNVPMDSDIITMIPGAEGQESEMIPLDDEDHLWVVGVEL